MNIQISFNYVRNLQIILKYKIKCLAQTRFYFY